MTKIIATIGPASQDPEIIAELIRLGVNVFRFNFKHNDLEWHREQIKSVKEISRKINSSTATLLDLQGPEIRLVLETDSIEVKENEKIILGKGGISFTFPEIIEKLKPGQKILADDGNFEFEVINEKGKAYLMPLTNGVLLNKKTINIANFDLNFPVIHDRDRQGLMLAKELGVDFIALSFVRNEDDVLVLRAEMKKMDLDANIVAKIETPKAIENIDKIIDSSDAIMVARGDLGVEMPLEEVPFYQKEIIKKCVQNGTPVITATQMLESMTKKKIPTRAEVSDVANAVYDFTDAVMLSGETASGDFPKESVKVMTKIAKYSEGRERHLDIRDLVEFDLDENSQMVCDSAFNLYKALKGKSHTVRGFIVFTQSGRTARMLSRYRPHLPIFAFCPTEELTRKLSTSFGVYPIYQNELNQKDQIVKEDIEKALEVLKLENICQSQDLFIVLHGDYWTSESGTSTIRMITV